MKAIFLKEIRLLLASGIGYFVPAGFMLISALFLWVFDTEFNMLNYGFADLSLFFQLAPWIFMFLIPALTMRSFTEERSTGTIELLLTRPIKTTHLLLGKWLAVYGLLLVCLILSVVFPISIYVLVSENSSPDLGSILSGYFGLSILCAIFSMLGIVVSAWSKNQILAFLLAFALNFLLYFGFSGLRVLKLTDTQNIQLEQFGMLFHYETTTRGLLDLSGIVYLISLWVLAYGFGLLKLQHQKQ
ncbi:MAG: ABC transporter permease subunit [Flavobacteriaceae bacterium]|nr:ABC transporter permease subunit [Flavobacteriaceae bacterium]